MALIRFDARVADALARAGNDPDAAAQALILAAEYLRADEPMPRALAEHLAGAFVSAANKPHKLRAQQLALDLHLTTNNRPKVPHDWYDVGQAVDELIASGLSPTAAITAYAADNNISESTTRRRWKEYKQAVKDHDEATRDD